MLNDSFNASSSSRGSWSSSTGLVLSRTGLIFTVAEKRHHQDPEVILHHLSSLPGAGEGRHFQGEWVPSRQEGRHWYCLLSMEYFHVNCLFSCTFCHCCCCCHCSFCYLIVFYIKFFLSQLMIFKFCVSNSPLPSAAEGRGKEGRERCWWCLSCIDSDNP